DLAPCVVLHEWEDVVEVLVLVVMGIGIEDENIGELALPRLLAGMGEKPGGVQLVDRYASAAFSEELHGFSLRTFANDACEYSADGPALGSAAGPALPHAELEHREICRLEQAARRDHHLGGGGSAALRQRQQFAASFN